MSAEDDVELRRTLVHLVRSGKKIAGAAEEVGRSRAWGYGWWKRYAERQDWQALEGRSRRPHHSPRRLSEATYRLVRQARSELEAEAQDPQRLGYLGASAVRARLQESGVAPVPSVSSIERELRRAGMTRPRTKQAVPDIHYPHLQPSRPHQLIQADILPRCLSGGAETACFNAVDVVSRYASGRQYEQRTAANACDFLWQVWQEQGVPEYQQVDNEDCFSGGHTHPHVLGRVIRLALYCGVRLVFSPVYHPASNGFVERFHQEYARFVWQKDCLPDLAAVRQRSALFFSLYRASRHHAELQGQSPASLHAAARAGRTLPPDLRLPNRLPLTAGQVHFMRAVDQNRQVKVLNSLWNVPTAQPGQGVWVTLHLSPRSAVLSVFDDAPDAAQWTCLAKHPFPLKEEVQPLQPAFRTHSPAARPSWLDRLLKPLRLKPSTMS